MRLLKPAWITHEDRPIFSIDIHPDGSRFATGGQGEDSGRVVIWNMAPVISEAEEENTKVPKVLCQMDNHLACVNCVRWSCTGKFLASGGDDKIVMIWQISKYQKSGNSMFSIGGAVNLEQWRCMTTLRGHTGDVLDLAWSPHDAWLASCSVDNTIIIWHANKFPEIIATLKGHTGLVKGVTWDPIGKYIASQSDDRTMIIWRTSDWQKEATVAEPFEDCGNTTHVLRLSWSPDGQYLVTAHAINGGGPTAQIIDRDGWKTDKDFVGHRKAITCVRFNANILQKFNKLSSKTQQYCCCAIGSRDRSLSIWLTALKRPLVVVHELFSNSVLDISWSVNGLQLMACSWDGTVAFMEFTEDELGKSLTMDEKNSLHQRMYGKSMSNSTQDNFSSIIIENPELLRLREEQESKKPPPPNQVELQQHLSASQSSSRASIHPKGPIDKQIETRTSDGKRRITPIFIPPANNIGEAPVPFGSVETYSCSTEQRSSIVIERRDEVVEPNVSTVEKKVSAPITSNPVENDKDIVVTVSTEEAPNKTIPPEKETSEEKAPPITVEKPTTVVNVLPVKRKGERTVELPGRKRGRPSLVSTLDQASDKNQVASPAAINKEVTSKHDSELVQNRDTITRCILPSLKGKKNFSALVPGHKAVSLTVHNYIRTSTLSSLHQLQCVENSELKWELIFSSPICAIESNNCVYVIACEDSSLHLLYPTGRIMLPPLLLCAPVSKLSLTNWLVLAITCSGTINIWDFQRKKVILRNESMSPLLESGVSVTYCIVNPEGQPMIAMSNGRAFIFSLDLGSWLLLGNSRDSVFQSVINHSTLNIKGNKSLPLASLQAQIKSSSSSMPAQSSKPSQQVQKLCTLTYLEAQISASRELNSSYEYKFWLLTFVRFLTQEGMEKRLRVVCDELLGPVHISIKHSTSLRTHILDHSKNDLLKEVLNIVGSNLQLQRLYTEFHDQLNLLQGHRMDKRTTILQNGIA